ncbi:hypothetical protein HERIO_2279 [Hepatospora eriocheir]|uniref:Uncharacterized protein n=1 Tax=Hepatospora eriocheir TaxID=1081669 RepID=A0A1X0Q7H9_9MICR|nr:hypothetical protein HERIO_2279 [Hepatospora eriocheir]
MMTNIKILSLCLIITFIFYMKISPAILNYKIKKTNFFVHLLYKSYFTYRKIREIFNLSKSKFIVT